MYYSSRLSDTKKQPLVVRGSLLEIRKKRGLGKNSVPAEEEEG